MGYSSLLFIYSVLHVTAVLPNRARNILRSALCYRNTPQSDYLIKALSTFIILCVCSLWISLISRSRRILPFRTNNNQITPLGETSTPPAQMAPRPKMRARFPGPIRHLLLSTTINKWQQPSTMEILLTLKLSGLFSHTFPSTSSPQALLHYLS